MKIQLPAVAVEEEENTDLLIPSLDEELQEEEHPVAHIPSLVCEGFKPELPTFFENFPFQLLPSLPHVVLSGETFHHCMCADGNFQLDTTAKDGVNEGCSSLEKDGKLECILARAAKDQKELPSHTNNKFLSHTQLSEKCSDLRKQRNLLQLQVITKSKQLHRLNKVLSLHQRFMVLISENNVLRVKELVYVALMHHRSINYIVEKVSMAVNKVYSIVQDRRMKIKILPSLS